MYNFLKKTNNLNIPIIFAGDFNLEKNSDVIDYIYNKYPIKYDY
jgi:hypothetical protein